MNFLIKKKYKCLQTHRHDRCLSVVNSTRRVGCKSSYADYHAMVEFYQFFYIYLQRLDSHGIEVLILILEKVVNYRYHLIIGPIQLPSSKPIVFHVWEQTINSQMVPNQENMERVIIQFDATVMTVMHSSHCSHRLVCSSIVLVKHYSLRQFSRPSPKMSLVLLFQVLNYLSSVGLSWRKQGSYTVSVKVEFNACPVSLLWHTSFLASLWTFQPILVSLQVRMRDVWHSSIADRSCAARPVYQQYYSNFIHYFLTKVLCCQPERIPSIEM